MGAALALALAACGAFESHSTQARAKQSAPTNPAVTSRMKAMPPSTQPQVLSATAPKTPVRRACNVITLAEASKILDKAVEGVIAPQDEPSACLFGADRDADKAQNAIDAYFVTTDLHLYCGTEAQTQYRAWAYSMGVDGSQRVAGSRHDIREHLPKVGYFTRLPDGCMLLMVPALDTRLLAPGGPVNYTGKSKAATVAAMDAAYDRTPRG